MIYLLGELSFDSGLIHGAICAFKPLNGAVFLSFFTRDEENAQNRSIVNCSCKKKKKEIITPQKPIEHGPKLNFLRNKSKTEISVVDRSTKTNEKKK